MTQNPITSGESKIRLTAFFVLVLDLLYLYTASGWLLVLLLIDFALRSFNLSAYSPLGTLSGLLVRTLRLPNNPVYMPPKRFAARIGFTFFVVITLLHFTTAADLTVSGPFQAALPAASGPFHTPLPIAILASVIAVFAALESLANFCAGCYVYNFLVRLRGH